MISTNNIKRKIAPAGGGAGAGAEIRAEFFLKKEFLRAPGCQEDNIEFYHRKQVMPFKFSFLPFGNREVLPAVISLSYVTETFGKLLWNG